MTKSRLTQQLGWVNKEVEIRVIKQCKIKFSISENYVDEVEVDAISLDVCGIVFGSPYMFMRNVIINAHKGRYNISLEMSTKPRNLLTQVGIMMQGHQCNK